MTGEVRTPPRAAAHTPAPWMFDVLLGLGVTLTVSLFIAADVSRTRPEWWAYLWALALGGLMLVRRRYPVTVLVLSFVGVFSYYIAGYPPIGVGVPLAAAVFSAAEYGRIGWSVMTSVAALGISVAYRLAVGQDPAFVVAYELPGHALLLAGAIALGDTVRTRRELRRKSEEISRLVADRYAREAEQRVMSERLAIARELHDSVGHALTVVRLHAQVAEEAVGSDDAAVRRALEVISDTTAVTFADLRRTLAGLRTERDAGRSPLRLADLGSAIRPAEQAGVVVRTSVSVRSDLPPQVEAAIYRVVQESITNVVRHASASHVDIEVQEVDGVVSVRVEDDGNGDRSPASGAGVTDARVADARVTPGHGITGMRERIHLLGGTFSARAKDSGFAVTASIPLEVGT
ncbi:sensor histidine kinase [Agromyces sp. NPDC049794]|uniref:sensor histidine kinase n=1 Tax=unclassified Agromyces TaxID=2639701 RepID=UPI0033F93AB3